LEKRVASGGMARRWIRARFGCKGIKVRVSAGLMEQIARSEVVPAGAVAAAHTARDIDYASPKRGRPMA